MTAELWSDIGLLAAYAVVAWIALLSIKNMTFGIPIVASGVIPLLIIIQGTFQNISGESMILIIYGMLFTMGLSYSVSEPISITITDSFIRTVAWTALSILLGSAAGILYAVYDPEPAGIINSQYFITLIPFFALAEELIFRNVIQSVTGRQFGWITGVIYAASLYGIMYIPNGYLMALLAYIYAIINGVLYYRAGNLLFPVFSNIFFKAAAAAVFLSGLTARSVISPLAQ